MTYICIVRDMVYFISMNTDQLVPLDEQIVNNRVLNVVILQMYISKVVLLKYSRSLDALYETARPLPPLPPPPWLSATQLLVSLSTLLSFDSHQPCRIILLPIAVPIPIPAESSDHVQ